MLGNKCSAWSYVVLANKCCAWSYVVLANKCCAWSYVVLGNRCCACGIAGVIVLGICLAVGPYVKQYFVCRDVLGVVLGKSPNQVVVYGRICCKPLTLNCLACQIRYEWLKFEF